MSRPKRASAPALPTARAAFHWCTEIPRHECALGRGQRMPPLWSPSQCRCRHHRGFRAPNSARGLSIACESFAMAGFLFVSCLLPRPSLQLHLFTKVLAKFRIDVSQVEGTEWASKFQRCRLVGARTCSNRNCLTGRPSFVKCLIFQQ